jgi:hypothetical protein
LDAARMTARVIRRGALPQQVWSEMARFTTTTVERATLRLLGVDGVDENQVPFAQPGGEPFAGARPVAAWAPHSCWRRHDEAGLKPLSRSPKPWLPAR